MVPPVPIPRVRSGRAFLHLSPFLQVTFLFVVCVLMIILQLKENPSIQKARSFSADYIHHFMALSARPFLSVKHFPDYWHNLIKAKEQNEHLHRQLAEFQQLHYTARTLMAENKKLREALKLLPSHMPIFLTAKIYRVIDAQGGAHLILDAGQEQGLSKDQAVMVKGYLVGRIIEVNSHTCRILPLTDPLSRIPVVLELSNLRAILAGSNNGQLALTHREENASIVAGELALSSGEGGLFPAGLPIGVMEKSSSGQWLVNPLFSLKDLTFGHVLKGGPLLTHSQPENLLNKLSSSGGMAIHRSSTKALKAAPKGKKKS